MIDKIVLLIFGILSNERVVSAFGAWLESRVKDPKTAVNKEYVEAQRESMDERVLANKVPEDGNIFIEQKRIEKIKKLHRRGPKR